MSVIVLTEYLTTESELGPTPIIKMFPLFPEL